MTGRAVILAILATALAVGGAVWWLQTRAYYFEVTEGEAGGVELATPAGGQEAVPVSGFRAIDANSSPIRFRACFTIDAGADVLAAAQPYEGPTPLNAPGWFDCFDARAIDRALEAGEARAFMGVPNIRYGIDRVVAAFPDGRGYAWHQINRCGEAVFNGQPPPEGCPPAPDESRLNYAPE